MADRKESLPKKSSEITRGEDRDIMESISLSWEEMAKVHCEGRNQKVALIIAYCIVIVNRQRRKFGASFAAAEWQMGRDIETAYAVPPEWVQRIQSGKLSAEERARIEAKFVSRQDAHRAPCELKLNSRPLVSYLRDPAAPRKPVDALHVFELKGIFGAVDPLPAIFNESDSQSESANLKKALVDACTSISVDGSALNRGGFETAQRAAFDVWLQGAEAGFARALTSNRTLRDAASDGSYARIYRDAKIAVLEHYRRFTASETPLMGGAAAFAFFEELIR